MKWSRKRPCWEQLDYYGKFGHFWDSNLFSVRTVNSHFYYYFLIMALWCRLNVETLSRYFLHVYVSQNRYWERVPTKIKLCAANFQILKIAETLAISSPYWIIHCCVVHLWNKFLILQKTTKIDIIARHKRILVEKSVILTQPTCPTDKARGHLFVISLFYNLFRFCLVIPIRINRVCDTETDQKKSDLLLFRNRLLNWKHSLSNYLYHKSNETLRVK